MENGKLTEKLILNTKLERKPTDLDHKACVIEKAIPVDHEKFLSLKNAPYLDEPLIAQVMGTLSDEEMSDFIEYCTGQLSDGVGESFEQKYVRTEDGEIKVSFWSGDDDWELLPKDEFMNVQSEDMEMSM